MLPKPHILTDHDSIVLLVDMQTGLLPAVEQSDALVGRVYRLLSAAKRLEVPIIATEHCADKIGTTTPMLAELVDTVVEKHHFDATREAAMLPSLPTGRHHVLVVGTEAHVCVLQTALGLAASGFTPWLVADGVGSRRESDRAAGLQRWLQAGGNIVTSEMAMFEWLGSARHPAFRDVLAIIKGEYEINVADANASSAPESQ